jgi:hypothetical protein
MGFLDAPTDEAWERKFQEINKKGPNENTEDRGRNNRDQLRSSAAHQDGDCRHSKITTTTKGQK